MVKLTSRQTFKIIRYLLVHPHTSQVEISNKAKVSKNLVNYVAKQLEGPGIVIQKRRNQLELIEPLRLLEELSIQRPLSSILFKEIRTEESSVVKVEKILRNIGGHSGYYGFTCFAALAKYTEYYITYPTIHVYSNRPGEFTRKIIAGRGDVAVQVIEPDSDTILTDIRHVAGTALVAPVQVVIDLFCLGGPGRDGAMKLYDVLVGKRPATKLAEVTTSNRILR